MRVTRTGGHREGGDAGLLTKNRIGNALAIIAAAVGLVLVFTGAGQGGQHDDAPAAPPPTSQVVPAPGQVQAPAPAAPPKTADDGHDDG